MLAVDGGNSKTDVVLVDAAGGVLGAARGPGASHHHLGVPAAIDTLEALVEAACHDAGLEATERPLATVGVWCLAGVDFPADDQALGPAIAGRRWAGEVLLRNDVFAVRRAGSGRTWGVGVVAGAGMNCVGVAPDGREVRFAAVGELSGDWGGGRDIGVAAVGAALRGEDRRGSPTTLTRLVPDWFGLPSALALVEALFLKRIDLGRVLEVVPLVFAEADAGDEVAGRAGRPAGGRDRGHGRGGHPPAGDDRRRHRGGAWRGPVPPRGPGLPRTDPVRDRRDRPGGPAHPGHRPAGGRGGAARPRPARLRPRSRRAPPGHPHP